MEAQESITFCLIGRAMQVHRELGPGLDEFFYHSELLKLLVESNLVCESKPRYRLIHHGIVADTFECDLLLENRIVVELKVLRTTFAPEHFAQLFSYLKAWKLRVGFLFNFGKESLEFRRILFEAPKPSDFDVAEIFRTAPLFVPRELGRAIVGCAKQILVEFGLGYCDTTYQALLLTDIQAAGVPCMIDPVACVSRNDCCLGEASLPCIKVAGECAVMTLALRDEIGAADRAVLQTYIKHLRLKWGVIFNFGKKDLSLKFVASPLSSH